MYANRAVSIQAHHNCLRYLRCRIHIIADVIVLPTGMYKIIFHDFYMQKFGPPQPAFTVHSLTGMEVIGSCLVHIHEFKKTCLLTINETDREGSVLLSCEDSLGIWPG